MPKISVILASYNHAPFVREAVTSVLDQSFGDLELLVVDDASTDGTPDVVEAIDDARLTLHRLKVNREYNPRNFALEHASGDFIAIQNSDDVWLPSKLEKQLDYLTSHPECGAVFTRVQSIDRIGNNSDGIDFSERNMTRHKWLRRFFLRGNAVCHSSVLMRHALIKEVGGYHPLMVLLSDMDLWVRFAGRAELQILPEKLTKMRFLENRANLSADRADTRRRVFFEFAEVLRRYAVPPIIDQLEHIFPEASGALSELDSLAGRRHLLAETAIRIGKPWHLAFAVDLQRTVLLDGTDRRELLDVTEGQAVARFMNLTGSIPLGFGCGADTATLYWSAGETFSKSSSFEQRYERDIPQTLDFRATAVARKSRLRYDPGKLPGRYVIVEMQLRDPSNQILWRLEKETGFDEIKVLNGFKSDRRDALEIISVDAELGILLPAVPDGAGDRVIFDVKQVYSPDISKFVGFNGAGDDG